MDRLKAMATFVRIVDSGSLTAAAEASAQSPASVVRALAALEQHLGVRLLNRNTRRLALTDEGSEFLAWSRRMLAEFDEVEHRFEARRDQPGGLLRLTAPVEFGKRHVAPLINAFLQRYPAIRVELILLDRVVDLIEEGLDLAIRIGTLPDSAMIAMPLGRTRLVVCASPAYLAEAAPIDSPAALRAQACIAFLPQGKDWQFQVPASGSAAAAAAATTLGETIVPRLASNQAQVVAQAGLAGLGVIRLLHYQVAEALADGRLVRLLTDFEATDLPVQLVYPHARLLSPRVRQLIDWATPRLREAIPDPGVRPQAGPAVSRRRAPRRVAPQRRAHPRGQQRR